MYLKRLEIHGFKSFADKTVMEFKPGITVVVGPNGSGKSNIADAVRWVLGEQSVKSLRGGKMEDVIFAGSEKRRSLGMAEVSLTIDNSSGIFPLEFNEVTVTRRLYRSGESDYLINRVPCRLRDVHELFMDTGVGREGISIIGQGKVDEILTVKPEERRGLIEEAAGIVRYRYRKRDAVKKLEDTENNLLRLHDIISELSGQKEPLAEQARTAKIYEELKAELDTLEIGLIKEETDAAYRRLDNIRKNRSNEDKELEELRTNFYSVQTRVEKHKLLLQKKEEKLSAHQESLYEENIRLEKSESEMKLITERISDLAKQKKTYGQDIQKLKEEIDGFSKDFATHKASGEKLKEQLEFSRGQLKQYETYMEEDSLLDIKMSQELEELKSEHFEKLQDETRINNGLNSHKQRRTLLERQEEQLRGRENQILREKETVDVKITELDKESKETVSLKMAAEENLLEIEKQHLLEERCLKEIKKSNRRLVEEKNNALARQRILAEMEREGQGYGQGVREILRQVSQGQLNGIIGTVAQVIDVPKAYELALEAALGNSLQHLITENEDVAKEAVDWLKKNDKGRATFLPLTTVKGKKPYDNLPKGKGLIGRLNDLVKYEERFCGIMENLMGRIWLVEDLAAAIERARETGFRYRIVTLDGQVVNAGGSITGGSSKHNPSGILSRKRNVNELEQAVRIIMDKIMRGEKEEEEKVRLIKEIEKNSADLKAKIQELHIKSVENTKIQERWRAEHERFRTDLENVRCQLSELLLEKEEVIKSIREAQEAAEEIKQRIQELSEQVLVLQETVRSKQTERIKKNEKLTQMRIEVATNEEKMSAFNKENSYLNHRYNQLLQYKQDKEREISEIGNKKLHMEENYRLLEREKEKQLKTLHMMERQLEALKNDKHKLQEEIAAFNQEVKDFSTLVREKEERLHQLDLQESRYETSLEALLTRLHEQFGRNYEDIKGQGIAIKDKKAAQQRITELKDEITGLGQVYLGAIEEYDRLLERLDFLTSQVSDMTEARERLLQVIKEMDQIMAKRFRETFVLVDQAFREMFTRLFGGGRAQLVLTQEDNILETGVDIVAQPPGKKTQYLSLLSGGEKTLTAIALLMAILKIKPSPFCVLDEIESNLDEANVYNFALMLKEFAQETQFVIISHRKGTMEIANVLYGVTIEETGVSSLVSVKLEDARKEAS